MLVSEQRVNVLVEGPDCAGKSTLVKELHNRLGLDALFLTHKTVGSQYQRFGDRYKHEKGTVFERGHISEAVYAEIFGRKMPFSPEEEDELDLLVGARMIVVFADPGRKMALQRYRARHAGVAQLVGERELEQALDLFRAWFSKHDYPQLIRYGSRDFDELESVIGEVSAGLRR